VTEEAWEGSAAPVHFSMGIKFGLGPGESRHCVKCCSDIFVLKKDTVQKRETQNSFEISVLSASRQKHALKEKR